jgi:hypothetical protein
MWRGEIPALRHIANVLIEDRLVPIRRPVSGIPRAFAGVWFLAGLTCVWTIFLRLSVYSGRGKSVGWILGDNA